MAAIEKKLLPIGEGGLAVHLPIAWVRHHKLAAKDIVVLSTGDADELVIKPKGEVSADDDKSGN